MAQANADYRAMAAAQRPVYQIMVDDVAEARSVLGLFS
jgi:hypothetical protein